jgi:PAS domain S-box-containing protein
LLQIFCFAPGRHTYNELFERVHPEDREQRDTAIKDAINNGKPYNIEYRIVLPDNNVRHLHAIGRKILDPRGKPVKFMATIQDITERKRAEEALRVREKEYRDLLETANSIIIRWDKDGIITFVNDFGLRFFGYSADELVGHDVMKIVPSVETRTGRDLDALVKDIVVHPERYTYVPSENIRKDGRIVNVVWTNKATLDAEGKTKEILAIGNDITQLKRAEDALKEAKQQAELYLDLMGHDISNMHQIIVGQLELAQEIIDTEGKLGVDDREMIDTSVRTLQRSARLIENVRNLQKLRVGEFKLERTDLGDVLDEAVKGYTGLPGREISINYTPVHGYFIVANPLIKDIFSNLLDNAVKHCDDPVRINVIVSTVNDNGSSLYEIAIEDNGRGIPDDKKAVIFDRLKRGDTKARGTGLGLFIVKTLVEGFDGTVSVEDRVPGDYTKGTRFVLRLPIEGGGRRCQIT